MSSGEFHHLRDKMLAEAATPVLEPGEVRCGNCLPILRRLPDNAFDWCITDPPYGQKVCQTGTVGGVRRKERRGFQSRATEYPVCDWDISRPDPEVFAEIQRVSVNQVIFGGNFFADLLPPTRCWLCWDKGRRTSHSDCELAWTSMDKACRVIDFHMNKMLANLKKEPRSHPTQKPVGVMEWIIERYTQPGQTILDPFIGSGTTLVAAVNLGRQYCGCDINQQWVDVATRRVDEALARQEKIRTAPRTLDMFGEVQ